MRHLHTRKVGLAMLVVLGALALGSAGLANPAADEAFLKENKIGVDGPALLEFFRQRTVKGGDEARIKELIKKLGDDSFDVREKASKELARFGPSIRPVLLEALKADPGAETRRRLEELLAGLADRSTPPEMVRPVRALEVLETLGSREARQLLRALAEGNPTARLTAEAGAALRRLAGRRD